MNDRIFPEHLKSPHFVEWAIDSKVPEGEWQTEYFRTVDGAQEKVKWAKDCGFSYLLGEIGIYTTAKGNLVRDYMYRTWNDYFDFAPARDGCVWVPHHAQSLHVEYVPHSID